MDEMIYKMMEINYIKAMGREVSSNPIDNDDLYPLDWFSNQNYRKKIDILTEAIDKKILIIDTEGYNEIIEGVKKSL